MNCKKHGIEVTGCSYSPEGEITPNCEKCLQMATSEKTIVKNHSTIAKNKPAMVKIMPILEVGGDLVWKGRS